MNLQSYVVDKSKRQSAPPEKNNPASFAAVSKKTYLTEKQLADNCKDYLNNKCRIIFKENLQRCQFTNQEKLVLVYMLDGELYKLYSVTVCYDGENFHFKKNVIALPNDFYCGFLDERGGFDKSYYKSFIENNNKALPSFYSGYFEAFDGIMEKNFLSLNPQFVNPLTKAKEYVSAAESTDILIPYTVKQRFVAGEDTCWFNDNLLYANDNISAKEAVETFVKINNIISADNKLLNDESKYRFGFYSYIGWIHKHTYIIVNESFETIKADGQLLALCQQNEIDLVVKKTDSYLGCWTIVSDGSTLRVKMDEQYGSADDAATYSDYYLSVER